MASSVKVIHDYNLITNFSAVGAGTCRWCTANKSGKTYFLKEFLSPVHPDSDTEIPDEKKAIRIKACEAFIQQKVSIYSAVRDADNGNIVTIYDFFRYNTKYYIVTEYIHETERSTEDVYNFPQDKKIILLKTLTDCLYSLHQQHLVHADLRPENIIIKRTIDGFFTSKLIDFDNSFLETIPPKDEMQGDPAYIAPEVFLSMLGDSTMLSYKIDVFALGLVFHQFLTGKFPSFDKNYMYTYEAVLNRSEVVLNQEVPDSLKPIMKKMLCLEPDDRPSYDEIIRCFPSCSFELNSKKYMKPLGDL